MFEAQPQSTPPRDILLSGKLKLLNIHLTSFAVGVAM
jgi:hypothetical protein